MTDSPAIISVEDWNISETVLYDYKDLLSISDLSNIFDVSKNTIYKSVQGGKFGTPIRIGRAYKIPKIYVIRNFFYNYK